MPRDHEFVFNLRMYLDCLLKWITKQCHNARDIPTVDLFSFWDHYYRLFCYTMDGDTIKIRQTRKMARF